MSWRAAGATRLPARPTTRSISASTLSGAQRAAALAGDGQLDHRRRRRRCVFTTRLRRSAADGGEDQHAVGRRAGGEELVELAALVAERGDGEPALGADAHGWRRAPRLRGRRSRDRAAPSRRRVLSALQSAASNCSCVQPASPASTSSFSAASTARSSSQAANSAAARSPRFSPERNRVGSRTQITLVPASRLGVRRLSRIGAIGVLRPS